MTAFSRKTARPSRAISAVMFATGRSEPWIRLTYSKGLTYIKSYGVSVRVSWQIKP